MNENITMHFNNKTISNNLLFDNSCTSQIPKYLIKLIVLLEYNKQNFKYNSKHPFIKLEIIYDH